MELLESLKRSLMRAFALGVSAVLVFGMSAPAVSAFAEDAPATDQAAALEQNQKTATELDENLETKVTLSFPGKREAEPADVVFVLDKSGASAEKDIYKQAKEFLEQVKEKARPMAWISRLAWSFLIRSVILSSR